MIRRCLGCRTRITRGSRCENCLAAQKAPYSDSEYIANRELVLARDNYECQLRRKGCVGFATTADHRIPVSRGGRSSMENMIAACKPCNSGKRDR